MNKTCIAFVAAAALFGGAAQAATIVNGSFEQPGTFSGSFQELAAGSSGLTGWTIGGGGVDLINTYWQHADGDYSLDMSRGSAGTISQTVTGLTAGSSYSIMFNIAGNPAAGNATKTLKAEIGSGTGTFFFDITGKSFNSMGWEERSFVFTATGTTELLSFTSLDNNAYGPALDNVRIANLSQVPLPAGGVLLLGALGLLGLKRRRG